MDANRRRFLGSTALIAAMPLFGSKPASAAGRVQPDDAAAVALGYVHAASDADIERFGAKAEAAQAGTAICGSCRFYPQGTADDWAPCPLFAGKLVARAGWCNGYVAID